jgi:heat-inducible transcriptional repressor
MIVVDRVPREENLRDASRFLCERLAGLSFEEAETKFLQELSRYQDRQQTQRELLQVLSRHLFESANKTDVYVEGTSNILEFPEFQDYESMRTFAQLVDEKEALGQVLIKELNKNGVQVKIGAEASPELKNFSVVSTCYNLKGRPVGVLGILGPKRMEYERMISIVDTVAGLVNRVLEGRQDFFSHNLLEAKNRHER